MTSCGCSGTPYQTPVTPAVTTPVASPTPSVPISSPSPAPTPVAPSISAPPAAPEVPATMPVYSSAKADAQGVPLSSGQAPACGSGRRGYRYDYTYKTDCHGNITDFNFNYHTYGPGCGNTQRPNPEAIGHCPHRPQAQPNANDVRMVIMMVNGNPFSQGSAAPGGSGGCGAPPATPGTGDNTSGSDNPLANILGGGGGGGGNTPGLNSPQSGSAGQPQQIHDLVRRIIAALRKNKDGNGETKPSTSGNDNMSQIADALKKQGLGDLLNVIQLLVKLSTLLDKLRPQTRTAE